MKSEYYWTFRIETSRFGGVLGASCDYITDENREAWQRFVENKIRELMKPETMDSLEFKECLAKVQEEKRKREEYDRREKELRIKHADERRRRSSMERPKITSIPKGLTVDYKEEYGRLLKQEVEFTPTCQEDFLYQRRLIERWYKKSVPQLIAMGRPDAAYGVSMALCKAIPQFIFREDIKEMLDTQRPQLRKLIIGAFEGLVESVKAWNNETERRKVCDFLHTEAKRYKEWRGMTQILMALIPSAAFTGEPMTVTREMNGWSSERRAEPQLQLSRVVTDEAKGNETEVYLERLRKQEEKRRMEAEKEARSLIPLNPDYEMRIFNSRNIGWDCDQIWHLMLEENKRIERLVEQGDYQEAALRFMQMTKSMCRHFVEDEHYNYFDDMYSPEYAIDDLIDLFAGLDKAGKLPVETKEYLEKAWQEIKETECYQDYGLPRKGLF